MAEDDSSQSPSGPISPLDWRNNPLAPGSRGMAEPPIGPGGYPRGDLGTDIARAAEESAREALGKGAAPEPSPTEPPSGQPMHTRDRRLYVILAWTAIPAALFVGCFIAWGSGQLPGSWAIAGMLAGAISMAIGTVYALEKKAPLPRSPGPIMIGIAILTWALVGWQTWLVFHRAPGEAPSSPSMLCTDGPCAPLHVKPGPKYLKSIGLGSVGAEPLSLFAIPAVTSDRLRIFVDYSEYRSGWMERTRAFIGELKEPVKDKAERLQLIYSAIRPNGGQNNLWWGDPLQNHPLSSSTYNGDPLPAVLVRGRVVIVGANGEQHHYFVLVRAAGNVGTQVGIIPEHDSGDWIEDWEKE